VNYFDEHAAAETIDGLPSKWKRSRRRPSYRKIGRVNCGSAMKVATVWFGTASDGDARRSESITRAVDLEVS
jgi:hypothetical protein